MSSMRSPLDEILRTFRLSWLWMRKLAMHCGSTIHLRLNWALLSRWRIILLALTVVKLVVLALQGVVFVCLGIVERIVRVDNNYCVLVRIGEKKFAFGNALWNPLRPIWGNDKYKTCLRSSFMLFWSRTKLSSSSSWMKPKNNLHLTKIIEKLKEIIINQDG